MILIGELARSPIALAEHGQPCKGTAPASCTAVGVVTGLRGSDERQRVSVDGVDLAARGA
jgi:hypothetical protein